MTDARLLQPTLEELRTMAAGRGTFRQWPLIEGAAPAPVILNQSRYLLTEAPLSYRWTIPHLIVWNEEVVGSAGGKGLLPGEGSVEIAYNVAPARRCRGLGTWAVGRLREMSVEDRLVAVAHVEPWNRGSLRALEKNGFRFAGTFRLIDQVELQRWVSEPALPHP